MYKKLFFNISAKKQAAMHISIHTLYLWAIPIGTAAWSHQLWCLHEAPSIHPYRNM